MTHLLNNITKTKDTITALLRSNDTLRDNDNALIAKIWEGDLKRLHKDATNLSATEFLELYSSGKISSPETIRRARQKIQETHPELRGNLYNKRKKEGIETRMLINKEI